MPTITLSWTDLALFAITAGLISGIVIIGRSNLPSGGSKLNPVSNANKTTGVSSTSKKRKNRNKKINSNHEPPHPSLNLDQPQNHGHTSTHHQKQKLLSPPPPSSSSSSSIPPQVGHQTKVTNIDKKPNQQPIRQVDESLDDQEFPSLPSTTNPHPKTGAAKKANHSQPKRPFAERHQQPVRKTIVDDMIDEDVQKPLKMARVMNIVEPESTISLQPTIDADEELEDGWEKVPDTKRSRLPNSTTSIYKPPSTTTRSVNNANDNDQKLTKRQRQNAKKKEAAKAVKVFQELERLQQLSSHKRDQERLRMKNASTSTSSKPVTNDGSTSSNRKTGGGAKASIGEDGRLIWE